MKTRSGIIYPRTIRNIHKINVYNIYNKCSCRSRTPTALALAGEPLVAVPLPVTILLDIEANGLCVRSRLRRRGWSRDHIPVLALCVSLLLGPRLLELGLVLHHQHLTRALLNVLLCYLKYPMQFSRLLFHAMHMKVRDERVKA